MAADFPRNGNIGGEEGRERKNRMKKKNNRKRCANQRKAKVYAGKMRDYKNKNVMSLTKDLLCVVTIVLARMINSPYTHKYS